jgi:hypothetical protein
MGEARVRLLFNTTAFGSSAPQIPAAQWLADLDELAGKRGETLQAEQMRIAQNTLKVAWIAAGAAIVAVLVGVLTWVFPPH